MTVYYDPKNKKVKPWVIAAFVIVPILLVIAGYILVKNYLQNKTGAPGQQQTDIFQQL